MADSKLAIDVAANVQQAVSSLKNVETAIDKIVQRQTGLASKAAGFLALTASVKQAYSILKSVVKGCSDLVDIYAVQEQAVSRLGAVMKAAGGSIGFTTAQLVDMAGALQKTTRFGDEAIIPAEQILIATNKLNQDTFPRAISLALDLAEATGTDAAGGAQKLAMALQDPVSGLRTLKQYGVTFTEAEKKQLEQLVANNKEFEAQAIVLDKVEAAYGGVAESVAKTDTGKLTQIKNVYGDIKEGLGKALLDTISPALDALLGKLQDIQAWVDGINKERRNVRASASGDIENIDKDWLDKQLSQATERRDKFQAMLERYKEKGDSAYSYYSGKLRNPEWMGQADELDRALAVYSQDQVKAYLADWQAKVDLFSSQKIQKTALNNEKGQSGPLQNAGVQAPALAAAPAAAIEPSAWEKAAAYIEELRSAIADLDEQIDMAGDAAVKKYLESQRQAKVDELAKYEGPSAVSGGGVSAFISENASSSTSVQKAASGLRIAQAKTYRESVSDISLEAKYLDEIIAALEKEHDELYGVKDAHSELSEYIQSNGSASVEFSKRQLKARIDEAKAWQDAAEEGSQEKRIIDEIIAALEKEQKALDDASKKANSHLEGINDFLARYGQPASSLISAGVGLADQLLSNQVDALENALSKMRQSWDSYYSHLKDQHAIEQAALEAKYEKGEISAEEYYEALEGLISKKQQAEEDQAQNEEALQKRIDDIKRRQFAANKANSIASALISGAGAVVKFLADPGGIPGTVLAVMAGVTTAAQVATIAAQQYTPMATGGIVTSPTHALIGEAGPEAIVPLSRADEYGLSSPDGGVIQINISIGNVYGDEDLSSRIFEGIEQAQKIGALPMWRYSR